MRLTTVARLTSVTGRLSTYSAAVVPAAAEAPPISFDQARHVGAGSRPGSWMAVAFRPEPPIDREDLAAAWRAVVARHGTLRTVFRRDPKLRLEPVELSDGGMPATPGMSAVSWLDHRRLPVAVDDALDPQHVSAVIRTDGVMIWFVVDDAGLHLRCRYPDTDEAGEHVPAWLEAIVAGMREPLGRSGNAAAASSS